MIFITFVSLVLSLNDKFLKLNRPSASVLETCSGGERCVYEKETVTITDTEFNGITNTESSEGGSVSLTYCIFTCTNSRFISCSTESTNGGAIYFFNQKENSKKSIITNCYFTKCHAGQTGGAIYFSQTKHETCNFLNCIFESNTADQTGSDLYAVTQSITLQNCTFANKDSTIKGPILVLENLCVSTYTWSNIINSCTFSFTAESSFSGSVIKFTKSPSGKPIEISNSNFMIDSSSSIPSSLKYIETDTPITFIETNNFGVPESQSISGSKINISGTVNYNVNPSSGASVPTSNPSSQPTSKPSSKPTSIPSSQPTSIPSSQPTSIPSSQPTSKPSSQPTSIPSSQPTSIPSSNQGNNDSNKEAMEEADREYTKTFKSFILIVSVSVGAFIVIVLALVITLIVVKVKYPSNSRAGEAKSEYSHASTSYKTRLGEELI